MQDDEPTEGLAARWSRLKRESTHARAEPRRPAAPPSTDQPGVDLVSLPPIDALDARSDYTLFLRAGVPDEIRRASLRRAWVTDPAIAGFRGMAEYDWDFNAPGYGLLQAADDVAQLARAILGPSEPDPAEHAGPAEDAGEVASAPSAGEPLPAPPRPEGLPGYEPKSPKSLDAPERAPARETAAARPVASPGTSAASGRSARHGRARPV